MPKASDNMPQPRKKPPTPCQQRIEPMMARLRKALDRAAALSKAAPADERAAVEEKLCLATRSVLFDFETWVERHNEVDKPAERELEVLLTRAIQAMNPGDLRDAVERRLTEFHDLCERIRNDEPSTLHPVAAGA